MAQPPRVLPSNAPPLRDNNDQRIVLQEHSVNRQQIYHHPQAPHLLPGVANVYDQKAASIVGVVNENTYQPRQPTYYPQYQQSYRPWTRPYDFDHDARLRVDKSWNQLYTRFLACMKYSEYRAKQSKETKISSNDKVWPIELEMAFFKALLYWPPMGRRKLMHKDKQRGRNELIADYIQELTGISRNRKQVSSHIQVLKPLVQQDEIILRWLSDPDSKGNEGSRHVGQYSSSYTTGRQRSTYSAPTQRTQVDRREYRQPTMNELRSVKSQLAVFEPVDFKIFAQPLTDPSDVGTNGPSEPLHIYTRSTPRSLSTEQHIADWRSLQQEFPVLAQMHASQPMDCSVLSVEASIAMALLPREDREKLEIGIILDCVSRLLLGPCTRLYCQNKFYKSGHMLPPMPKDKDGTGERVMLLSEAGDKSETRLKFGSHFWAATLSPDRTLGHKYMLSTQVEPEERDRIRQEIDADIRSITATQEISILTTSGLERVLVMHWSFRLSNSEVGSTSWRQLHLPLATSQVVKAEPSSAVSVENSFDFNAPIKNTSHLTVTTVAGASAPNSYPALQSPFEYDSASGSAPSPATWPTTVSTSSSTNTRQNGVTKEESMHIDGFDTTQSMMMFDGGMNLDAFDTTAFGYGVGADGQYAADAAAMDVQAYTQQWSAGDYGTFDASQWQEFTPQQQQQQYNSQFSQQTQHTNSFEGYEDYQKHAADSVYDATTASQVVGDSAPTSASQQAFAGAAMMERVKDEQGRVWSTITNNNVQ